MGMRPEDRTISEGLALLVEAFNLSDIYVFGSRAKEMRTATKEGFSLDPQADSDVDIAVEPAPGQRLSARDKVRLTIALEDLFHAVRVDLLVLSEAPPFLALDVIHGELIYCGDADAQAERELEILRRAGDLAHYEREKRKQLLSVRDQRD